MINKKARSMYATADRANLFHPDYASMDDGIRAAVQTLAGNGIETCQSCQGGEGHAYPVPTIEFVGGYEAGFRALAIAMAFGLKVAELRRVWTMQGHEPVGPHWAMTFYGSITAA